MDGARAAAPASARRAGAGAISMPRTYTLLLHDAVRAYLLSLGSRARQRLCEKLEFLQHGLWDTGVRVKRLKGAVRAVFEARLSRGDRILFTLGRATGGATPIYVWGVVQHDDVSAAERRIVPAHAPFLDFRPLAVEQMPELDADALDGEYFSLLQSHPAAAPGADARRAAPAAPWSADAADTGPQRWLVVDDEEWRRLQGAHRSDHLELYLYLTREQARLLGSEPPLLLSGTAGSGKTTIAVYFLLRHRVRRLDAAAGSRALAATAPGPPRGAPPESERALFLTHGAHLKRFSERMYRGLVAATDLEQAPQSVRFATYGELLEEILSRGGRRLPRQQPAGLAEFRAIFQNHPAAARYDAELVWEEIRAIVKGAKPQVSGRRFRELAALVGAGRAGGRQRAELAEYVVRLANLEAGSRLDAVRARKTSFASLREFAACLRTGDAARHQDQQFLLDAALRVLEKQSARLDQPLLTLREYEGLGAKRAPNFPFERREIHALAVYYQEQLEAAARHDEIDLTRAALQYLERHDDQFRYDLVVCDEVQDFTDLQLALLFRLAEDPRRTVLSGDPKQIINPSGFRWEEVRARYYERGLAVPEVVNLSINFRSVGNIVGLANELLLLKRSLVGAAAGEIAERWTFRGRPPLLADGVAEAGVLAAVRLGGAGQVVLVRTERERDRLRTALQSELVFTIADAKGLEFDAVLLWRFAGAAGAPGLWRRIASGRVRGAADAPHIRHELNLLYVAVTRARSTLVIWDGASVSPIWGIDSLAGHVYRSTDALALSTIWQRVSTPAEWEAQGDYFAEREHYAAAEECYRNAQASAKEEVARAHRLELEGDHRTAADLFAAHGRAAQAAANLERVEDFSRAARHWRRAGEEARATASEARHYEAAGNFKAAARRWQQLGDEEAMLRTWERGRQYRELAAFYRERKAGGEAARYLKLAGDHAAAAVEFRRAGLVEFAAQEFERAGDYKRAGALYRRLGDSAALLRCLASMPTGGAHEAALVYEEQRNWQKAAEHFRRYADSSPEARADLERRLATITPKRPGMRAAVRMDALGQHLRAAPIYERRGHVARAAELYGAGGEHEQAARCLAACGRPKEAAREVLRSTGAGADDLAVEYLVDYALARPPVSVVQELSRTAGRLLRGSDYRLALAHYLALSKLVLDDDAWQREILAAYAGLGRHGAAIRHCLDIESPSAAHAYLDEHSNPVLSIAEVEALAGGSGEDAHLAGTRNDGVKGVLFRVMNDCLQRGCETDRRPRLAALLADLPPLFAYWTPLSRPCSDLLIALRSFDHLVATAAYLHGAMAERDEDHAYFLDRLRAVADAEQDRELTLCTLMEDEAAFEAAVADLEPAPHNAALLAVSAARYGEAVAILVAAGRADDAATVCLRHRDFAQAGRIHEQAGDLLRAARTYRDAELFADARRCYAARGDQAGVARVFERERRHDEAMAIWQRLGREREIERLGRKMGRGG